MQYQRGDIGFYKTNEYGVFKHVVMIIGVTPRELHLFHAVNQARPFPDTRITIEEADRNLSFYRPPWHLLPASSTSTKNSYQIELIEVALIFKNSVNPRYSLAKAFRLLFGSKRYGVSAQKRLQEVRARLVQVRADPTALVEFSPYEMDSPDLARLPSPILSPGISPSLSGDRSTGLPDAIGSPIVDPTRAMPSPDSLGPATSPVEAAHVREYRSGIMRSRVTCVSAIVLCYQLVFTEDDGPFFIRGDAEHMTPADLKTTLKRNGWNKVTSYTSDAP